MIHFVIAIWIVNAVFMLWLMHRMNVRGVWLAIWILGCVLMLIYLDAS